MDDPMPSISVDDSEIDEAVVDCVMADAGDEYAPARELLELAAEHDAAIRSEAVEIVANHTDYNKSTARDWMDEIRGEVSRQAVTVHSVEKIFPYDEEDDVVYEFDVTAGGSNTQFRIASADLQSSSAFEQQILELTDTLVEFDDWQDTLNEWLEIAEITSRKEEPVSVEHSVAEKVVNRIGSLELTDERKEFRENEPHFALVIEDDNRLLVPGKAIDQAARNESNVDIRKVRAALDDLLVGNSETVRRGDDYFRAWNFDLDRLADGDIIDLTELQDNPTDDTSDDETDTDNDD